jgi:hypothetical protein
MKYDRAIASSELARQEAAVLAAKAAALRMLQYAPDPKNGLGALADALLALAATMDGVS